MTVSAKWMPYRLFPYEVDLGRRELRSLSNGPVRSTECGFNTNGAITPLVDRLTYFSTLSNGSGVPHPTNQWLIENDYARRGHATDRGRQSTRYGLHGIHEYKGKFNPQVVRALCNVVDPASQILIDPFCGSGTSLLEALRLRMDAFGVDRSPMAWFIASTKASAAASRNPKALERHFRSLVNVIAMAMKEAQQECTVTDLRGTLSQSSIAYLRDWFTFPAFCGLSAAISGLESSRRTTHGRLVQLALSSILRQVSLQLPEDLRVRRRPAGFVAPPLWETFVSAADRIADALSQVASWASPAQANVVVKLGSAADPAVFSKLIESQRRLVLTSPPYATALPYIDTDRLSIIALGLADASEIMTLERSLVGSREWTRRIQSTWSSRREENANNHPVALSQLLDRISRLNNAGSAGFRKRAVPDLLYRYFSEMGDSMAAWSKLLRKGEHAILIVGHNRTTAGGQVVDIPTPDLLAQVGERRGFKVSEIIRLETWPRYGLHAHNGVDGEDAVVLTRC
jgi:site-specific DNA-methyltransferase (cytosine-N4-specific)